MFCSFDSSGIEDAATGPAACTLMAYLSSQADYGHTRMNITQSVEMGRRSEIQVDAERSPENWTIALGGNAVHIMRGQLLLP